MPCVEAAGDAAQPLAPSASWRDGVAALPAAERVFDAEAPGLPDPDLLAAPHGPSLAWHDVRFSVGGGRKDILRGVSGCVRPGRLCAIMGPSGAGKTSLLNILAGRMRGGGGKAISGEFSFHGKAVDPVTFRRRIAYVMQDDALFATQTAEEAIAFSAAMRLPSGTPAEERRGRVEEMLAALRLQECRDTYIGSRTVAGLSGGQRKRVAVGVELVTDPDMVFLDEPTSGLDSFQAKSVVERLRHTCHGAAGRSAARSVVCTIHQPSSEVFCLFDDVIMLARGKVCYAGPRDGMTAFFAGVHSSEGGEPFRCPTEYNPADYVMEVLQTHDTAPLVAALAAGGGGLGQRGGSSSLLAAGAEAAPPRHASLAAQFGHLAAREARNVVRDRRTLGARFGSTIFIMVMVGVVFQGVGSAWKGKGLPQQDVATDVGNHFGALAQVAIAAMFGISQPLLIAFPMERPVFLREYASGFYGVFPYLFSKLLTEIPLTIVQSSVMFLVGYWLLELQGEWPYLMLTGSLLGLSASSLCLILGAAAAEVEVAMQLMPLVFVPQFLFAGFFVATTAVPHWLRWAQYLCILKYALNLFSIIEFGHDKDGLSPEERAVIYGGNGTEGFFASQDIRHDRQWQYAGILAGIFLGLRLIAMALLARKGRSSVQ